MGKLPSLPHGEGSYGYVSVRGRKKIRFRKLFMDSYVTVYGDTVNECQKKMNAKLENLRNRRSDLGTNDRYGDKTVLGPGISAWLKTYKYGKVKDRTYDSLESTFTSQILKSPLASMQVQAVTSSDIQDLVNSTAESLSISTVKKTYSLLKQYFKYYYNDNPMVNPMNRIQMPKKSTEYRLDDNGNIEEAGDFAVLNDEEIEALSKELSAPYVKFRSGYRNGHGILFIMWSFVRLSEARGLQWKDIDFDKKTVNIYKTYARVRNRDSEKNYTHSYRWAITTTKTGHSTRTVPVCDRAIDCLLRYREIQGECKDTDFIFTSMHGKPLTAQFLNNNLQRALIKAGINTRVTIHGLRHTGISYFIRHGVSDKVVSELAGHSDVSITNRIYYNVIEEQKKKAIQDINEILQRGVS